MKKNVIRLVLFGLALGVCNAALAASCQSRNSNRWSVNGTWNCSDGNHPPNAGDTVTINNGDAVQLDVNTSALASLTIQSGGSLVENGAFTLNLGGPLAVNGSLNIPTSTIHLTAASAWSGSATNTAINAAAIDMGGQALTFSSAAAYTIALSGATPLSNHGSFNNDGANKLVTILMNGTNQSWTVYSTQYPNLQISNSGAKTYGASSITLLGNLIIDAGTTFDATAANSGNSIAGNLVRNGTFNTSPGSGSWSFNGTAVQTITGGVSFYSMIVANSSNSGNSVVLSNGDLAIGNGSSGALKLISGNVVTGGNKVTVSTTCNNNLIAGNNWINGNLQLTFPGFNTSCTFRIGDSTTLAPVTLTIPFSGSVGSYAGLTLTASTTPGDHPNIATSGLNAAKSVNRYWTLGSSGDTFGCVKEGSDINNKGKYTAKFEFVAADRDSGSTTGNYKVGRFFGGWATPSASATSATSTSIDVLPVNGNATFGTFAIGEQSGSPSGNPASSTCEASTPLAEWRMEEQAWTGATGEVKDSSGYGYNGTAGRANGSTPLATTTLGSSAYTNGTLSTCRYGQFDSSSTPVRSYTYVKLESFPTLPTQFTFAAWVRTTDASKSGQRILVNDDGQNGWGFSLGDGGLGTLRLFNRNISASGSVTGGSDGSCGVFCMDTPNVIANNSWYFVAVTVNTSTKDIVLYVFNNAGTRLAMTSGKYSGTWANGSGAVAIGGETSASAEGQDINYHFRGNIDEVKVYNGVLTENNLKAELTRARACGTLDHVEFVHDGSALTCMAEPITVLGCTGSASCYQNTASQSGDSFLVIPTAISGAKWCTDAACSTQIPGSGVTLSSGAVIYLQQTTASTVTMGGTSSPAINATLQCKNTTNGGFGAGSPPCDLTYGNSGLLLNATNHLSCTAQTITIQAVSTSDTTKACIPAFASVNRNLSISLSYLNPSSGTKTASFDYVTDSSGSTSNVSALSTGSTTLSNLYWDSTGKATLKNFSYPDVGQVQLNPSVLAPTGVTLTATSGNTFIAAPKSFNFTTLPSSPIRAGENFAVKVSAMNNCATPAVAPNFGQESPAAENATLTFDSRVAPSGTNNSTNGPYDGSYSGTVTSWTAGVGTSSNSQWSEVGQMTIKAALSSGNYLTSGMASAIGTSATVGDFVPAYFDTTVVQGCSNAFTYSGQPFTVTATARNAQDVTTLNYSHFTNASNVVTCSVCSHDVTLTDANASASPDGSFTNNKILASAFKKGEGKTTTVTYTFNSKLTAPRQTPAVTPPVTTPPTPTPQPVMLRALDSNTTLASPLPTTLTEQTTKVRSGRLRLSNAFNTGAQGLSMPMRTEYWNGNVWVANSDDSCTALTAGNFYRSNTLSAISSVSFASGVGALGLSQPSAGATGSMDIAANLGTSGDDQSCLSGHGGNPGNLPWLRSVNGNCAATYDRDPSARATFGIYTRQRIIHTRELFF